MHSYSQCLVQMSVESHDCSLSGSQIGARERCVEGEPQVGNLGIGQVVSVSNASWLNRGYGADSWGDSSNSATSRGNVNMLNLKKTPSIWSLMIDDPLCVTHDATNIKKTFGIGNKETKGPTVGLLAFRAIKAF
jgi:hypothetical protein